MAVRSTVTTMPPGPGSTGSGTSSTRTSPGPCRTVARMTEPYPRSRMIRANFSAPDIMTQILQLPPTLDPQVIDQVDLDAFFDTEDLWAVIVWNDDVTTFQTVIQAFVEIFNHSFERADQLAWKIHRTGKAVAAIRPKDEAEAAVRDLHRRKISASLARA